MEVEIKLQTLGESVYYAGEMEVIPNLEKVYSETEEPRRMANTELKYFKVTLSISFCI